MEPAGSGGCSAAAAAGCGRGGVSAAAAAGSGGGGCLASAVAGRCGRGGSAAAATGRGAGSGAREDAQHAHAARKRALLLAAYIAPPPVGPCPPPGSVATLWPPPTAFSEPRPHADSILSEGRRAQLSRQLQQAASSRKTYMGQGKGQKRAPLPSEEASTTTGSDTRSKGDL